MRPEDAAVACGAAKIDPPTPAAPSGEASTGADTSKTLRRSSFVLSEVKGIYVREARTLQTGPPAAVGAEHCAATAGARRGGVERAQRLTRGQRAMFVSRPSVPDSVVRDARDPKRASAPDAVELRGAGRLLRTPSGCRAAACRAGWDTSSGSVGCGRADRSRRRSRSPLVP